MKKLRQKIKKVQPLIMSRKAEFRREMTTLAQIKDLKMAAINHLKQNQQKYMIGVDQVNQERQNGQFAKASVLEPALEFVKAEWHKSLRQVQKIEKEQDIQTKKVLMSQQDLKSIETLEEKYQIELDKLVKMEDQKILDEISITMRNRDN